MEPIKAIIIDDEVGARESLANILDTYFQQVQVLAKADSAASGFEAISTHQPELVFLDIEMPRGNAFDLLERFDQIDFTIIFVTAYDQYALKAMKFSALDYLLKPVDIEELTATLERFGQVRKRATNEQLSVLLENLEAGKRPKKLAIPEADGLVFIRIDDIIRCESDGNYTNILLNDGKRVLASRTLGEFEELFSEELFVRTHRSHLINLHYIKRYIKGEGGFAVMSDGSQVEVSRRKKSDFLEALSRM